MKKIFLIIITLLPCLPFLAIAQAPGRLRRTETVVITPYKTTMVADGKDVANITISVQNRQGDIITSATNLIHFTITGDAKIISITNGQDAPHYPDTALKENVYHGELRLVLRAGRTRSVIIFKAASDTLSSASSEIHTVQPGRAHPVTSGAAIAGTANITYMVFGAYFSFLPKI
jgi:hypothetical protein